jgi:hypothetical protein
LLNFDTLERSRLNKCIASEVGFEDQMDRKWWVVHGF